MNQILFKMFESKKRFLLRNLFDEIPSDNSVLISILGYHKPHVSAGLTGECSDSTMVWLLGGRFFDCALEPPDL